MILHGGFRKWHDSNYNTPNHHGIYNGLNLVGVDLPGLFLANKRSKRITVPSFLKKTKAYYKVAAPKTAGLELIKRYPWLKGKVSAKHPSWEITFSAAGIPIKVATTKQKTTYPVVTWVKHAANYHKDNTKGRVGGTGSSGSLTKDGTKYARLVLGQF